MFLGENCKSKNNPYQFTFEEKFEKQAQKIIEDCIIDVNKCLLEHKTFLLILSKFLSENSRINKDEIEKMALEYFKKEKIKPIKFVDKDSYTILKQNLI